MSQEPWERYEVPATLCPRISKAFLEEERRAFGEWWFRQEYLCEFMETEDQLFSHDLVEQMLDNHIQPLFGQPTINSDKRKCGSALLDESIRGLETE